MLGLRVVELMGIQFVRYCRSKSDDFGNAAKKRNVREAWISTKYFLDTYTDYNLSSSASIELYGSKNGVSPELLERITSKYGNTELGRGTPYRWRLTNEFDEEMLNLAFENEKYEGYVSGPVVVLLPFEFRWKNIDSDVIDSYKEVFECFYRGSHGQFHLIVSEKIFIQSEFIIPYPIHSSEFDRMLSKLRSDLPFKLSDISLVAFDSLILKNGKTKYKAVGTLKSLT